jgi:FKBP-type peptidyl-prolyl cis-trans isomerase
MKKIILGACAALALVSISCDKQASSADETSAISSEMADSITMYYGKNVGNYLLTDFTHFQAQNQSETSKDDIIKGMQIVFGADANEGTTMGMQVAVQILNEINSLKEQGIVINRNDFIKYFKESFMQDSINEAYMQETSAQFQGLMQRAQKIIADAEEAKKAEAPEAKDNLKAGEEFVAKAKKADADIKTTDSGLSYKIINEGEGDKPKAEDNVLVHYTGKLIDGKVFDSSVERGEPAKFSMQGVVPGFREGLMLLGKGGKATLYIPASLAYGTNGVPQAGIGPNATLIFEVELIDINPQD